MTTGWRAPKRLSGDLLFDVLVPDTDHFDLVADRANEVFRTYDAETGPGGALLPPGSLVLGDIWHHVHLDVDEKGVEAAAAEPTGFSDVGGFIGGGRWPDVRADRPFLFRIRDESTGATLFLGQITDPTAAG